MITVPFAIKPAVDVVFTAMILGTTLGDGFVIRVKISQHTTWSHTSRHVACPRVYVMLAVTMCLAGCSAPKGRWQLVKVDPPDAAFPITQIEFGSDGAYQAKGRFTPRGEPMLTIQTTTGKFKHDGGLLRLAPTGHAAFGLATHLRLDGKMVMTLQPPGRDWKVIGIFERVTPIDPRLLDTLRPITPASVQLGRARPGRFTD